jgi:hypothetical protein
LGVPRNEPVSAESHRSFVENKDFAVGRVGEKVRLRALSVVPVFEIKHENVVRQTARFFTFQFQIFTNDIAHRHDEYTLDSRNKKTKENKRKQKKTKKESIAI